MRSHYRNTSVSGLEGLKGSAGWPVGTPQRDDLGTSYHGGWPVKGKARGWTYHQTLRTGVYEKDTELKVMFDEDAPDTITLHEAAGAARNESDFLEGEVGAVT